ncbi:deoxyribodipyrimidine photo-lyase [Robiginitalea sp. SC105]|uniref:cryptochrome/photolyase family protein n=1 Tax=Robiginitalea sp. SC105 TaxID=2762332 RepID=UPI001639DF6B|nr:deoxyribodipyrimidine photo-lyase [Robiginitalea sp. SC105]MBC2840382.1 deoxyribodipyrimidine photo-lyase [Robiginitalea sp. SC105]
MSKAVHVFWFRRDLRLEDNRGLFEALSGDLPVLPVFIFDTEILEDLPRDDARVTFLHDRLQEMRSRMQEQYGSSLAIYQGKPVEVFRNLLASWEVRAVYTNHDYEPYARKRDEQIRELLKEAGVAFHTFKDQVIFEKDEVVKDDGDPYVVYTPYMRKWKEAFKEVGLTVFDSGSRLSRLIEHSRLPNLDLGDLGFERSSIEVPGYELGEKLIDAYEDTRNFPAREGTSRLGPHLRFGTVSIRTALSRALNSENETFWNELIWREFFMQILWHFPHTVDQAFRKEYDRIEWRNDEAEFEKWKKGETGYALVDAGMRQLNSSGYMHNRVRMLVASFLCKHLLIDWRWGEAYFAEKLLDYELASNVGNWQWAAGSGVDAAPYFRIFNPMTQVDKFDREKAYIRKWIPEYGTEEYPDKMVDHKAARERCLQTYKAALN